MVGSVTSAVMHRSRRCIGKTGAAGRGRTLSGHGGSSESTLRGPDARPCLRRSRDTSSRCSKIRYRSRLGSTDRNIL